MKAENRNPRPEGNPKSECRVRLSAWFVRISVFGLLSDFGFRPSSFVLLLTLTLCAPATTLAGNSPGPHAAVQTIGLDEIRWTSGFWFDRFENLRTNMLPGMGRLMEGTNYSQYFENFRIAAGLVEGRPHGAPFNDGDFYKLLEAASATLAVTNDAFLVRHLDRAIDVVAKAQRADGYLHTPVLIRARHGDTNAVPFRDRNNFEMYNMGHLMTAAYVHHRVTGRTNFLAVARRAADFLDATMSGASPESARSSVCPSHYMGLVELWRTTREPRYLALARKFFALRSQITDGGDDNQDRIPFEQQTHAMGHAVRANYLYAGAADLFMETGDVSLWKPLGPIWTNVVQQKMHLTGGCGALYDGASPDGSRDQKSIARTHQAYGRNYQLPNTTAHNETCAAIGSVLWNWRMFLVTGEARFVDVMELALHNAVLAGVSLDGTNFFYTNPLRVTDPMPVDLRWSRTRVPFVSSFCCPPNVLRTLAESAGHAYAKSSNSIWVNLYGASTLTTKLGGQNVQLTQETEYPWNGRVRITFNECGGNEFALKLRIPGWVRGARLWSQAQPQQVENVVAAAAGASHTAALRLNGSPVDAAAAANGYLEIERSWKPGDMVELDLPMPARLMEANPLVEETLNQVAVQRGPIVYCLESVDLPSGTRITDIAIPSDIDLVARHERRLLGGVVVLEGIAQARATARWSHELYREVQPVPTKPVKVSFIPYSVWANRGATEMSVWLPLALASQR